MSLTRDQVKHVAKLASLPLSEEEEKLYSDQLSKILDYVDQLNQVDTSGVEPTYNVSGNRNITQRDLVGKSLTQKEALKNAAREKDGFFVTKGVFGEE